MRVLGTAGHVDHGKSSLVQAITGINPDRLREEQDRQMTIDLGFAWLVLPSGEEVGIVDVPGHRDFIENMLAGVGSIDAALLVVAADEGVMPQTKEHLAILDLLEIEQAVVALTKVDLIEDPDWLVLVEDEVRSMLAGTRLAEARMVPVSARSGAGLDALVGALDAVLQEAQPASNIGRPRLWIDRVFTLTGFGTVVTGTLVDGVLSEGEEVEILPSRLRSRIRGLQTHKTALPVARPGSRVAANLAGLDVDQLERGDVVTRPQTYKTSRRIDVHFRLLSDAPAAVKHNQEVKLFLGSAQCLARVRLLGTNALLPGQDGWLQLELEKPLAVARGDRYILRRPSPAMTIGGGQVVDPSPGRRHRLKDPQVIERLESLLLGSAGQILLQSLQRLGPVPLDQALLHSALAQDAIEPAIQELQNEGAMIALERNQDALAARSLVVDRATMEHLGARLHSILTAFHRSNPLRRGMLREECKSKMLLEARAFNGLIAYFLELDWLKEIDGKLALAEFRIEMNQTQRERVDELLARFAQQPTAPPSVKDCRQAVGEAVYQHLLERGSLVQVSEDVVFAKDDFQAMSAKIKACATGGSTISVAEARDIFQTSRKFILALMEYLDANGLTRREGDVRVWIAPDQDR